MTKWPSLMAGTRKDWLHISEAYQVIEWSAINFNTIIFLPLFISQQIQEESLKKLKENFCEFNGTLQKYIRKSVLGLLN